MLATSCAMLVILGFEGDLAGGGEVGVEVGLEVEAVVGAGEARVEVGVEVEFNGKFDEVVGVASGGSGTKRSGKSEEHATHGATSFDVDVDPW